MNKIGFGIFCFGEEYYFKGTTEKIRKILDHGYHCFVLTDNPEHFKDQYSPVYFTVIPYYRHYKSYYDKMTLPKYIFEDYDIAILIDADTHITDYSFLDNFKTFEFEPGVSYINTLLEHPGKKKLIGDFDMNGEEWLHFKKCAVLWDFKYREHETIWEYFLVINKDGFNLERFYKVYEDLQLAKEFSDLGVGKSIIGAGEGMAISIASKFSETPIRRDLILYDILKNKMSSVSRRYTPKSLWPEWMK